ncbi:GGDEF domain-containing protein [Brevibacillus gelatini]|uniref:GGDEF domain-containing protein n=1 Tax=Brevibacillus gelatini TaxID=1655277 RepID=A0A3M8AI87_9BACL|nr:sensor domain-containing diguanylate cyclase [Brevibacillus gelatini]RNB50890.1 GGDEF domain-containing protein [Brevibacillus gelatini]
MPVFHRFLTNHGKKIGLTTLLTGMVSLSILLTLTILLVASYQSKKKSLIDTTLTLNYSSAIKMSQMIDSLFQSMRSSLRYSASVLIDHPIHTQEEANEHLEILRRTGNYFNSLTVVDETGTIRIVSPPSIGTVGEKLVHKEAQYALALKKPYISSPYISKRYNRLLLFLSEPLYDKNGRYRGFIGGTIYLQDHNILNMIIGSPDTDTPGFSYTIVGSNGQMLFHPDKQQIGKDIGSNTVVKKLLAGNNGYSQMLGVNGDLLLAGYALVPATGWGVIVTSPMEHVYNELHSQVKMMLLYLLPPSLLLLLIVIQLAHRLARPFVHLANLMSKMGSERVEIPPAKHHWNREADLLTRAFRRAAKKIKEKTDRLTHEATTDVLTGLANRRSVEDILQAWTKEKLDFSVLLLDIDHFKHVNDTFGHLVGDEVLKLSAEIMKSSVRKDDVCGRFGGEEFIVLLRNASINGAFAVAEKIRTQIKNTANPTGNAITVSVGIVNSPLHGDSAAQLIDLADQALYQAKESGRNKVVVADSKEY